MTKVAGIAVALVAVFTGAANRSMEPSAVMKVAPHLAVGEPASWLSMMTDVAVDDEGRITGRSQHCDRIALRLASLTPLEVALEYGALACAGEARAIAQSFPDSMARPPEGFHRLNNPDPPCVQWPQGCWGPPEPRECVQWPEGGRPRWVRC